MPPITIDLFSEGKTEQGIAEKLCSRGICPYKLEERGGGGEDRMLFNLSVRLKDWFDLALEGREPLRILVLRDLDSHQNKTVKGICDGVSERVKRHHPQSEFVRSVEHDNVFKLQSDLSGLHLALHVANDRYSSEFIKTTIDDYVLKLALCSNTAASLLESCKKAGWEITTEELMNKVQSEIPALLKRNRIPLIEAKDCIRLYATVLQAHASPAVFAGKVLEHAEESDIKETFSSLLAAIQLLVGEANPI